MSCGPRALALLCLRDRPLKGPGQMAESHWVVSFSWPDIYSLLPGQLVPRRYHCSY